MESLTIFMCVLIGGLVVAVIVLVSSINKHRRNNNKLNLENKDFDQKSRILQQENITLATKISFFEQQRDEQQQQFEQRYAEQNQQSEQQRAEQQQQFEQRYAEQKLQFEHQKLEQQQQFVKQQENLKTEFKNLANEILETSSKKLTETNKQILENTTEKFSETNKLIIEPFKKDIDDFKKRVNEIHTEETKSIANLGGYIDNIVKSNKLLSDEANNLASALKGDKKKQGDWGELVLENVLQYAGLVKDRDYETQVNIKTDDGNNLRPDVLVNLPDDKVVVIDSKVSLVAYERYCSEENEELREQHLRDFVVHTRKHFKEELGTKQYQELLKSRNSIDFMLMFIPIEPAYLLLLEKYPNIWQEAYAQKVILISPTNLIACLRLIDNLWKVEKQNKNVQEIANMAKRLYEKFASFADSYEKVGKQLQTVGKTYEESLGQLKTGRGNYLSILENMKNQAGISVKGSIPQNLLQQAEDITFVEEGE